MGGEASRPFRFPTETMTVSEVYDVLDGLVGLLSWDRPIHYGRRVSAATVSKLRYDYGSSEEVRCAGL